MDCHAAAEDDWDATEHYGLGAVNYHTGETVVIIRKRKRSKEVAELLP